MGTLGRITLSLPPAAGNARNSEGAFYTLDNGAILFAYSKFIGDEWADDGKSAIAARVSEDEGETWSDDRVLFYTEDHNAKNIMSVSFLPMANGDIGIFYLVRMGWHDTRLHFRRSSDNGVSWGAARPCIPAPGFFVTNNDRVIRLKSGRIIVPANLHRMKGFDTLEWSSCDLRGIPCVFYSDDDGDAWAEAASFCLPFLPESNAYMQETGVIEKLNGVLYAWMRTDVGRQYESYSIDEGLTWTMPAPSRFTSPNSPLSMKRAPDGGKLLAVWNPVPNYNGRKLSASGWGRTPLVCAVSPDDGKTWGEYKVIEDDPDAGFCYTAIHFIKGNDVLLAYCSGGPETRACLSKLTIRKINADEIFD